MKFEKEHIFKRKTLDYRRVPRCPRRWPQLVTWAADERAPELVLSYSHTDQYLAYHLRTHIWQWCRLRQRPTLSNELSSQGLYEEQKEREHEQKSQENEGCAHPMWWWGWSIGSSPRPAELVLMEQVIKLDSMNVADKESWLRSQVQWHWVLILLHGQALWEPSLFGCSPC